MEKLLVLDAAILARNPVETDFRFEAEDVIYQKTIIPGWEMVDAELPPGFTLAGYGWDGAGVVEKPTMSAEDLAALRQRLVVAVDDTIAAIYARWTRFETEYTAREAAARAFAAGGYEGDPGVWVTAFATPAGLSAQAAADRIIEQADGLRGALEQLGALRMAKYGILAAGTAAGAQAAHDTIIAQAGAIAGTL
ncbi:MAG: hypothetical protein V4724_26465 [Pseudomonadota bacterium]